jgi:bromodomain-containing factor 1
MEKEIERMKNNIESLKEAKKPPKKIKKKKEEKIPVASTSKPPPKQSKPVPPPKTKKKSSTSKASISDEDVLSFEQKKDLSESIGKLDGAKLERVIAIIHEGVPEIRDVSLPVSL